MAKATKTVQQAVSYKPQYAPWFVENQRLYNWVVAFYVEVIQAHTKVLDLPNKAALTALETLTHATTDNPHPVMPLTNVEQNIPAMFRRAAINAALGSARPFFSTLKTWKAQKAKAEAKGKKFNERPPVPPRIWNKSVHFYAGMYKARTESTILLKVWTGSCWSWVKVYTSSSTPSLHRVASTRHILRRNAYRRVEEAARFSPTRSVTITLVV